MVNSDLREVSTMDDASSQWSNESMADSVSLANQEAMEMSSQDWEGVEAENEIDMNNSNIEDIDIVMGESGSGETMFDPNDFSMVPPSFDSNEKYSKPPNIVVYCGKKDANRKFESLKQVLYQCVHNDCYVVYHLKHDEVPVCLGLKTQLCWSYLRKICMIKMMTSFVGILKRAAG